MSVGDDSLQAEYLEHKKTVIALELNEVKQEQVGSKKSHILKMIDILRMQQVPDVKISSRLYTDLEGYVSERFIRHVASIVGCTDPSKDRSGGSNEDEFAEAVPQNNGSDSEHEVGVERPYWDDRQKYIAFFNEIIELSQLCVRELKKDTDDVVVEIAGKEQIVKQPRNWSHLFEDEPVKQEYFAALGDMFARMADTSRKCFDERQSILPFMLFPIIAKVAVTTIKHFSTKHFVYVKNVFDITTKKCTQFLRSEESVSALLDSTRDESWKWHYLDVKCPLCREEQLQPKMYEDGRWDLVCKNWEAHNKEEKHFPSSLLMSRIEKVKGNIGGSAWTYLKNRKLDQKVDSGN